VWVRLLEPVSVDRVATAMAGTVLPALAGAQFSAHGRYQHYLLLTWTGERPDALREAVCRLGETLAQRGGRQAEDDV
jgi:DNA-binding transcriptional MocR family regulator